MLKSLKPKTLAGRMKKKKGSKKKRRKKKTAQEGERERKKKKRSCEIYIATGETNQVMLSGDMNACVTLVQEWSYIGASDWTKQKPTVWNTNTMMTSHKILLR